MKKSAEPKVPEGYKDEAEFLTEARDRFQMGVDFDRENRDAGMEDAKFAAGEQWDEEAKASRAGLPCLVINRLPQFIAQVVGDIRINRPSIRVRPAEDADKDLADVREGLIRAIERDCDAQGVYATAGQSQVTTGIGNFRVTLKYAGEMAFERDIALAPIPDPFSVVWDPASVNPTGRDAVWCFINDSIPRKEFEARFPDEQPSDLVASTTTDGWSTKDEVRVSEYWRVIDKPMDIALLEDGSVVPADKVPAGMVPVATRKSSRKYACMYLITGHTILEGPFEWPIDRVPILRVQGWEFNVGDKRVRFGLVRWAKDPQRLLNYWRSVAAQTLALAPKGKWLASASSLPEDREDDFRNAAKSADPLLIYEGSNAPTYTNPPPLPGALLQEAALNAQDMKDVTGLHDASLGARSNETSGRAIMARQREGDVATYIYHDNLKAAISEAGKIINALIPTVYDTARTIRIVGEDETTKVQRINDPNHPKNIDINQGRYDVAVETGPSYTTKRQEAAESLMQFVQAIPAAAGVASDLIAKAMDWPMADTIAERLKKTIPPQILESEEGQEPPKPDPAQAMQAQMQQMLAELDIRTKHAQAMKAEFDADKAKAEAYTASVQAGIAPPPELMAPSSPMPEAPEMPGQPEQGGEPIEPMGQEPQGQPMQGQPMGDPSQFGQGYPIPEQPATGMPGI